MTTHAQEFIHGRYGSGDAIDADPACDAGHSTGHRRMLGGVNNFTARQLRSKLSAITEQAANRLIS